jgi:hypothetical protein
MLDFLNLDMMRAINVLPIRKKRAAVTWYHGFGEIILKYKPLALPQDVVMGLVRLH